MMIVAVDRVSVYDASAILYAHIFDDMASVIMQLLRPVEGGEPMALFLIYIRPEKYRFGHISPHPDIFGSAADAEKVHPCAAYREIHASRAVHGLAGDQVAQRVEKAHVHVADVIHADHGADDGYAVPGLPACIYGGRRFAGGGPRRRGRTGAGRGGRTGRRSADGVLAVGRVVYQVRVAVVDAAGIVCPGQGVQVGIQGINGGAGLHVQTAARRSYIENGIAKHRTDDDSPLPIIKTMLCWFHFLLDFLFFIQIPSSAFCKYRSYQLIINSSSLGEIKEVEKIGRAH